MTARTINWLVRTALVLLGAVAFASSADAQDRPRIVVAVIPSGEIPEGIDRDVQDLFLTALADRDEYELVDRQTIYEVSQLDGDVDLLLCVTRPDCLTRLREEQGFEQYVIVKVNELGGTLEFTYVTFNYMNRDPLVFGDSYQAPVSNPTKFVERAYEVAAALELTPVDASVGAPEVDPCADVTCTEAQVCVEGRCLQEADGGTGGGGGPEESSGVDWRIITGGAVAGVGLVSLGAGVGLLADRESRIQGLGDAYQGTGAFRVSGFGQNKAAEEVDTINTFGTVGPLLLIVGGTAILGGAGLLTWALIDDGGSETDPNTLSVVPAIGVDGVAVDARVRF